MLPWLQRRWRTGQLRSKDGGEMNFSFEFLYSFGPTHARKFETETEMILTAFNNTYTVSQKNVPLYHLL